MHPGKRMLQPLRIGGLYMAVMLIWLPTSRAQAPSEKPTPSADPSFRTRPVVVPEGTPVKVHFLGEDFIGCVPKPIKDAPSEQTINYAHDFLIQVDEDVVIDGAVVVPHGSLGVARLDGGSDKFSLRAENHREKTCYFHMMELLGIDAKTHTLDHERFDITPDIPGTYHDTWGGETYVREGEFTARLKQDTITVPLETTR